MPILRFLLLAAVLLGPPSAARAQSPPGLGTLTGTTHDSATGAPIPGVLIVGAETFTLSDSGGRYTVRATPGVHPLRIFCPSATLFSPQLILRRTTEIRADSVTRLELRIDRRACTEPPPDPVDAKFEGHFVVEFEHAEFVPCPGAVRPLWSPDHKKPLAWLHFLDAALKTGPKPWPATDTGKPGGRRFGRFRGRFVGPGTYGHMGMASYLLTVEEILDVRTPGPGDCG